MYGRTGLDRFKKAQSLDPFSVTANPGAPKTSKQTPAPPQVTLPQPQFKAPQQQNQSQSSASQKPVGQDVGPGVVQTQNRTQVGVGQSTWQPPDWAIEPRPGFYYLEVLKDGEAIDRVNLDKKRTIFGRQFHTCDFVLDHQSVSRQHAAVVPHKNGSIYVIDLGSAHGTFVANERLTKDSPVELEPGQSLRFAASTRIYVLRKDNAVLFPPAPLPAEINLPPSPDPTDEEAVVSYNTFLNRYGLTKSNKRSASSMAGSSSNGGEDHNKSTERTAKRIKKLKVAFRDQVGGDLVEVVGISDGADVETEPGPLGVKEGSLVGKYESLVQTTVIPKGKELFSLKESVVTSKGVTDKLQEVLNKVKNPPKGGIYDDLFGSSLSGNVGSSWAFSAPPTEKQASSAKDGEVKQSVVPSTAKAGSNSGSAYDESDDDLFGD